MSSSASSSRGGTVARASASGSPASANAPAPGRAVSGASSLDRLIHERMRLAIVSALAGAGTMTFGDLKKVLKTTDGNLSVHARKLEEAGYVTCVKGFEGRVPRTEYRLTAAGRRALHKYLDHMESLIHAMRAKRGAAAAG